jgi:hypothetical protein
MLVEPKFFRPDRNMRPTPQQKSRAIGQHMQDRHILIPCLVVTWFGMVWPYIAWNLVAAGYRQYQYSVLWVAVACCTPLAAAIALAWRDGARVRAFAGGMLGQAGTILLWLMLREVGKYGP